MAILAILAPVDLCNLVHYDPQTGAFTWKHRDEALFSSRRAHRTWNAQHADKPAFTTVGPGGYLYSEIFNRPYRAHRVAWAIVHGEWPEEDIDHINGCTSDNRLTNLRSVSRAENNRNSSRSRRNQSGVTGVSYERAAGKWRAQITTNRQSKFLGLFDSIEDAIVARKAAEKERGFHRNHGRTKG